MSGKLAGGTGMHGGEYQIQLYMLFLLKGYEKNNFYLRAEDKKGDKFDDLICGDISESILLQAKHKTNLSKTISADKIFATQGEFSLLKYLDSYIETQLKFPNATYVICSNIGFNKEVCETYVKIVNIATTSMLYNVQKQKQYFYSFETEKTIKELTEKRSKVNINTIRNFLKQLRFIMLKDDDIKQLIEKTIRNLINFDSNLTARPSYNFIFNKLKAWFNEKKLSNLSNLHLDGYLSEMSSREFFGILRRHKKKLTFLDIPIRPDKQIIMIKTTRYFVLMVKLHLQMFEGHDENVLFLNPDLENKQGSIIRAFKLERFTHLVCQIPSGTTLQSSLENVLNSIVDKKYKQIIILTKDFFQLRCQQSVYRTADNWFYKNLKLSESLRDSHKTMMDLYLPRHLVRFNGDEIYTEDKLLSETLEHENEIVLISDVPGMGKSTVLSKFTSIIKKTYQNLWPIKIDLNSHSRLFKDCIRRAQSLELNELLNYISEMETFEKQVTTIPRIILLMLDGLDEISYDHINLILNFIKSKNSINAVRKIIITARPHVAEQLEQEHSLNIKTFKFIPLTNKEQYDYINKNWTDHFKITDEREKEKCQEYSKLLLENLSTMVTDLETLIGVPLLLNILSEIFEPQAKNYCSSNSNKNAKVIEYDTAPTWNLAQLYEKFMERKKEIFVEEKSDTHGNKITTDIVSKQFEDCAVLCENLAMPIFFSQEICNFFKAKTIHVDVTETLCDIGIITRYEGKWNFVHRTFAEYLVAKRIFIEIISCNPERIKYLIENVLLQNYDVNCSFNSILEAEWYSIESRVFQICGEKVAEIYGSGRISLKYVIMGNYLHILKLLLDKCDKARIILTEKDTEILHFAVACGHFDIVKYFIEQGVSVNSKDEYGRTALHYCGKVNIAIFLITKGANINSVDVKLNSVLCSVTVRADIDVVKYLVENGADVNSTNYEGFSILHFAVYKPYVNMVDEENSFIPNSSNKTPVDTRNLNASANYGNPKLVKFLIENGACVNATNRVGNSVLHRAVCGDSVEIVKILVENDANVNAKNDEGDTVLHLAAYVGCVDILKHLVEEGADINAKDNDHNLALHLAACEENVEVIKYLKTQGSDVNARNKNGISVLHAAAYVGNIEIVKYLIENGANKNAQDELDNSVLHKAVSGRHEHVVQYLINKGAHIYFVNVLGNTVLLEAAQWGNVGILKRLIEVGADITAQNNAGNSALHLAAANTVCPLALIKWLVEKGAQFNIPNANGQSVLHISASNVVDTINVVKYLVSKGANVNAMDNEGKSILHVAVTNTDGLNVVKFLVESGADVDARDNRGISAKEVPAIQRSIVQYLNEKCAKN